MADIGQLTGTIKYYDWGGREFIPSLLGITEKEDRPYAEYWLGTHPQADCMVTFPNGEKISLKQKIADDPQGSLGKDVAERFGTMPYLLKALDVKDMLSIQVHPSKEAAVQDFAAENEKGIPLDSPARNYKDDNHKPELMVAMDEFWLLHGFKPSSEMEAILSYVPELLFLLPVFNMKGYEGLYKMVMEMPQEEVNERLQPLLDRILPFYKEGRLDVTTEDFWAAKGSLTFSEPGRIDRGIFSIYLFNLVQLQRGDAVFQNAGVPHAYLSGQNVEIMASSDNVLRGGLTRKHIDVDELLRHVKCEPTYPRILKGEANGQQLIYKTPAPDFELSGYSLAKGEAVTMHPSSAEILLLVSGEVELSSKDGGTITLRKGQPAAVLFPGNAIGIRAKEAALVYRAVVPVAGK
jgi:mannose-6-phosphate isomerase